MFRTYITFQTIPDNDAAVMSSFYNSGNIQVPILLKGLTAEDLIQRIGWRVFTEWCCNPPEQDIPDHSEYIGQGFTKWVGKETHYALVRDGWAWDNNTIRFLGRGDIGKSCYETRQDVLCAVVLRSFDFFSTCPDGIHPAEGDRRNLRASLEDYLPRVC